MKKPRRGTISAQQLLTSVPYVNEAMRLRRSSGGGAVASIPVRRPSWLVPPISWLLPFSEQRRIELDAPGTEVLDLCDGRRTVESIIEKFSADHKLTFREAQLSVTTFLRQLVERGLVVLVGQQKDPDKR